MLEELLGIVLVPVDDTLPKSVMAHEDMRNGVLGWT